MEVFEQLREPGGEVEGCGGPGEECAGFFERGGLVGDGGLGGCGGRGGRGGEGRGVG